MVQSLSMDLRSQLLAAVDDGMSCRGAAARLMSKCTSECTTTPTAAWPFSAARARSGAILLEGAAG